MPASIAVVLTFKTVMEDVDCPLDLDTHRKLPYIARNHKQGCVDRRNRVPSRNAPPRNQQSPSRYTRQDCEANRPISQQFGYRDTAAATQTDYD
jgi:hypothetical protein